MTEYAGYPFTELERDAGSENSEVNFSGYENPNFDNGENITLESFKAKFLSIASRLDKNFKVLGAGDTAGDYFKERNNLKMELISLLSESLKAGFSKDSLEKMIVEVEAQRTDSANSGLNNSVYLEALESAYIDRPKLSVVKKKPQR